MDPNLGKRTFLLLLCAAWIADTSLISAWAQVQPGFHGYFKPQALKYARESSWVGHLSGELSFASSEVTKQKQNLREAHVYAFYEPGKKGDWNVDVDQAGFRFQPLEMSSIALGRFHPALEGSSLESMSHRSAIGSHWAQNQSTALEPRVVGWLGAIGHFRPEKIPLAFTLAYSPIFIPNFGPRLELSEVSNPGGARFSNVPPSSIKVGEAIVPLRYKLQTDSVWEIVRQDQLFFSAGLHDSDMELKVFGWSAPNPNPVVDASGILKVDQHSVNALATARPKFPQQNFLGIRTLLDNLFFQPELEVAYETTTTELTVSIMTRVLSFLDLGYLHTDVKNSPEGQISAITLARYDQNLLWIKLRNGNSDASWQPSLLVETHLKQGARGSWWRPELAFRAHKNLEFLAHLSLLTGDDHSYYGNWRSLDSVGVGARGVW